VRVEVALTIAACPLRSQIERDVRGRLEHLDGVHAVEIVIVAMDAEARAEVMARARWKARDDAPATAVDPDTVVLAIASGKGGVGKSSVTVNLAVALPPVADGRCLDADIWVLGARLLGMEGDIEARAGKMVPSNSPSGPEPCATLDGFLAARTGPSCGAASCSTGRAAILGGRALGRLDYLLIDLPPGTGDVQMGLPHAAAHPAAGGDHPAPGAQKVASRAADMARRGYLRVAGVIENMSDFTCEHGATYALFGSAAVRASPTSSASRSSARFPSTPTWRPVATPGHRWRPSPGPGPGVRGTRQAHRGRRGPRTESSAAAPLVERWSAPSPRPARAHLWVQLTPTRPDRRAELSAPGARCRPRRSLSGDRPVALGLTVATRWRSAPQRCPRHRRALGPTSP